MSQNLISTKQLNTCQQLQTERDEVYYHGIISIKELNAYQRLQMKHDEIYHREIFVLGISQRMNHVALHLIKYLAPLSSLPTSEAVNSKAFIDSFIMVVSASNLLGINLAEELVVERNDKVDNRERVFLDEYIQLLAQLAKACEATDHQEDYPIRSTWNKTIKRFFCLLVREAISRNISLLEEANHRLHHVETKHSLNDILQEKE